jgi:hypothetical protein
MKPFVFETQRRTLIILSRKQRLYIIPVAMQNSKMLDHSLKHIHYRLLFCSHIEFYETLMRNASLNTRHQSRMPEG